MANSGSSAGKNVSVADTLVFSPAEGGTGAVVHTGVGPTLGTFRASDSIYAFFPLLSTSLQEREVMVVYDLTYTISSDSADEFLGDTRVTHSPYRC